MIVGLVTSKEAIEKRFEVNLPESIDYMANYNIHQNQNCLFISSEKPSQFSSYEFGMVPSWSKESYKHYLAPVENHNTKCKEGLLRKDIIVDPAFRKAIRSQRGILPVDFFIVPGRSNNPYLIFSPDKKKRPIALACIWDCWKKEITDPLSYGFAILTIPAFGVFKEAGMEYLPLVLHDHQYRKWIKPNLSLTAVTEMLIPIPKTGLNAFPISPEIWNNHENNKHLIIKQGELLIRESSESKRIIMDKFQRKKFHEDPDFDWGYMKLR